MERAQIPDDVIDPPMENSPHPELVDFLLFKIRNPIAVATTSEVLGFSSENIFTDAEQPIFFRGNPTPPSECHPALVPPNMTPLV